MTTAKPQTGSPSMLADGDPRPRRFTARELQAMLDAGIITAGEMLGIRGGKPRPFTHVEYHAMDKAGVFAPDERVQLVAGEIVVMSPMGSRHAAGVSLLIDGFATSGRLAGRALAHAQLPVVIPDFSEPEPDFMLLARRDDRYALGHPRPEDVLLLVEVADSTLAYDRRVKLPLYAAAGIPESWLLNLRDDVIEAHADPSPDGYRTMRRYRVGDDIAPAAFPDLVIPVSQLIPARS